MSSSLIIPAVYGTSRRANERTSSLNVSICWSVNVAASSRSEHASVERDPIFGDRVDREFASEPPTIEYSNNRVVVSVLTCEFAL